MKTKDAIKQRRAVKSFNPNHVIPDDMEHELFSLALLSPTAFNIQNWRFVVVKDPSLKQKIRTAAWDQAQVTDCSLLVILCADVKAWEKDPRRYWKNADQGVQDHMAPAIDGYYRDKEAIQHNEAFRSTGIAAQTLMLTAKSMGYDSCPMVGFDFNQVATFIKLPKDHVISMFVAIGKATKEAHPRGGQLAFDDVIINNSF